MRTIKHSQPKCFWCGKFIKYKDINNHNKVKYSFTPDSEFTTETHTFEHLKCIKK